MSEIIVGVYDSRRDAETARDRLVENGVDAGGVVIEEGPRPDQSALPPGDRFATRAVAQPRDDASTFVDRMFSGALIDDANVEHYTHALRDGKCVLAVRTNGADETRLATSLLARATPRVYSLPNAPTAWKEATEGDPASIGGVDRDPARPEGLLDDAEGLPAASDRMRLANARRTR